MAIKTMVMVKQLNLATINLKDNLQDRLFTYAFESIKEFSDNKKKIEEDEVERKKAEEKEILEREMKRKML